MNYSADNEFIYLSGLSQSDVHTLSAVQTKKGYRIPKNIWAYRELYKMFPILRNVDRFIRDGQTEQRKTDIQVQPMTLPKLRPYQNEDVAFLSFIKSGLVLNEPRTGKTPTTLSVMNVLKPKKTLIITPASLVYNWKKEIEVWCPDILSFAYSGTAKQKRTSLDDFDEVVSITNDKAILIVSKDTLKTEKEGIKDFNWDCVIVDEAHYLRNYKTAQSKAVFGVHAKYRFALTGTPAVKHSVDVYGLFHFLNPKAYPSYWQFADRYFHIVDNNWGKEVGLPKQFREEELKGLMARNSVQRKRKDVMKWLPKAQHQNIYLEFEPKQAKLYKQMLETFEASEGDVEIDTQNILVQLIRLRQLCLEPALLGFESTSSKTKALLEFAENNSDPFIVMTMYSSYFDIVKPMLEKLGKKVGVIRGSVSQHDRFQIAEDFQNGKYDILLCNIIAAGTGFTLDKADTIVFLDKSFTPADNEQAQDRIVPVSEERYHNINIISFVIANSVDERVNDIIDKKLELTNLIRKGEFLLK